MAPEQRIALLEVRQLTPAAGVLRSLLATLACCTACQGPFVSIVKAPDPSCLPAQRCWLVHSLRLLRSVPHCCSALPKMTLLLLWRLQEERDILVDKLLATTEALHASEARNRQSQASASQVRPHARRRSTSNSYICTPLSQVTLCG